MKKIVSIILFLVTGVHVFAEDQSIDQVINDAFQPITDVVCSIVFFSFSFEVSGEQVSVPFVLVWLVTGAIFFTAYFKFINFRGFKTAIDIVRGKYTKPGEEGEVSHFQALTAALSGTVGLGNIGGVAIAISIGGAGATFWMIVAGLIGMSSKFVECTLGVKFRTIQNGVVYGGPMYYLEQAFSTKAIGKTLAIIFAVACVGGSFGGGNMYQSNQAFSQFSNLDYVQTNWTWLANNGWAFGLFLALIVGVVILGGIKRIASWTDKIVPFMVGIYLLAALIIIFSNFAVIPDAFMEILNGAFAPTAIGGGVVGVMIQGFKRSAFSNEAGIGSASIAHSAVKTEEPVTEGLVALLEPFIDTVVICTMTALVLVITGFHTNDTLKGVDLTSAAFGSVKMFSWFPKVLTVAVILFAFSTMISWSYYGAQSWAYLFGKEKAADISYKVIFCGFVVVGAAANLGAVIDFSDAMIFLMSFPNIIGLVVLAPVVKEELDKFMLRIKEN